MALPKRVRDEGGSFYKGYKLTVSADVGDYTLDMTVSDKGCAVNGIIITPDAAGVGDYFKLEHLNAAGTPYWDDGSAIKNVGVIAETVYNMGKYVSINFDFVSLELLDPGHKFRLTYTNVSGTAMNVYTLVERIK
jgi:hypothetical protein